MNIINIENMDTEELINNLINIKKNRTPTIIKNGLKYFPKIQKWNEKYIIEIFGDNMGSITIKNDARPEAYFNYYNISYKDYFDKYTDTLSFTRKNFTEQDKNTFIDDIEFTNPFFTKNSIISYIFYTGPINSGLLPHKHGDVFNLMVYGEKKWIFFENDELNKYYKFKYPNHILWQDWYDNEYETLKKTNNIIEYIQEKNDIIYVPRNYIHTIVNKKKTMGIVIELNN